MTGAGADINVGQDAFLSIAVTNYGTAETTGTVTSTILSGPLTVVVPAGETVIVQVVWSTSVAGINSVLFTVTADSDAVVANNVATVDVVVLP